MRWLGLALVGLVAASCAPPAPPKVTDEPLAPPPPPPRCETCIFERFGNCRVPISEAECDPDCCTRRVPAADGGTTLGGYATSCRDCREVTDPPGVAQTDPPAKECVVTVAIPCPFSQASCGLDQRCDPSCCP